ncbi:MAG TPA: hypothetical protein VL500_01660 [Candidatus Eisenbacteria bacterium]|jgi:hypothetical protein|nr:hypothetical protein [Candidatus Eisenbacteria bacterium]
MDRTAGPQRKNSELYFVISSLTQPPPPPEPVEPDITDFAPDVLEPWRVDIDRVTKMLAADPLVLKQPERKLRLRMSAALSEITGFMLAKHRVLMLSASAMVADAEEYPRDRSGLLAPDARHKFVRAIRTRLTTNLADTLVSRFDARLMDSIGTRAHCELGQLVSRNMLTQRLHPALPHVTLLGSTVQRAFRECVRLQFGCIAAGMDAEAKRITAFTEFFCCGNFPLGTMDDGTFLVLVE